MTLESAAKFEGNYLLVSKNDMANLVNFNASMTLSSGPNFEEKLTFCLKNDIRTLMNFNSSSGNQKICTFMEYFCQKYVMFELK